MGDEYTFFKSLEIVLLLDSLERSGRPGKSLQDEPGKSWARKTPNNVVAMLRITMDSQCEILYVGKG